MRTRFALVGNQAFSMLNFRGALITSLVERDMDVFALAPDYSEAQRDTIRALGATPVDFRMQRNGINPFEDSLTFISLVSALRRIRPEVSLSYAIKPVIYGTLAAAAAGVPRRFAMIEGLGHIFLNKPSVKARLLKGVALGLYRIALDRAERTFFLNSDDKADFLGLHLVAPQKAHVIGAIGIDLDKWQVAPIVTEPMTFLFVGRLLREKGIAEFIEAARRVKGIHPQTRFVVLGDVDTNPSSVTRQQVSGWAAEGLIDWPGHVDVGPWLARSSVFVLPSYREGVPRSTQEAMAMGRPVITTNVPGCRDTVVNGENGFLVPSHDAHALAGAMVHYVENPELVARQGTASRKIAEALFDVRQSNARLIEAMA
jgi:glycosyltransferase involved in cell wall biosynthesis